MVQAWYLNEEDVNNDNKHKPHQTSPPQFVSLETLSVFGLNYWKIKSDEELENIVKTEGYNYNDEVTLSPDKLENYEQKMKRFYEEHVHSDDETRYVIEGSGYFDIRNPNNDKWIRVQVVAGDMISVPSGLYHRYTNDENDYGRLKRFFKGVPVWTAYNREDGVHSSTIEYFKKYRTIE